MEYLDRLNPEQKLLVETTEGPVLASAAAGSGKTFSVVCRVANIIENGVLPENILMITFTNKAAQEMRKRVIDLVGEQARKITACTFHSLCAELLRRYGSRVGLSANFDIITPSNCVLVLDYIKESINFPSDKRAPSSSTLVNIFSLSINKSKKIIDILNISYPEYLLFKDDILKAFNEYIAYKKSRNVLDFDDLLVYCKSMLELDPVLARNLSDKYKYIIVDEFQDTNILQLDIVKLLRQFENKNICVIGDFHQSIYLWRGAEPQCINDFPKIFPNTKIISLETNYRSSQEILDLANEVINKSVHSWKRNMVGLFHDKKPNYVSVDNNFEQSKYVIEEILSLVEAGTPLSEIAVLSRTATGLNEIELELLRLPDRINYKKFGGIKFLEKEISQDFLAFLQMTSNSDVEVYWMRFLKLYEGIGPVSAQYIADKIIKNGLPSALTTLESFSFDKSIRKAGQLAVANFKKDYSFVNEEPNLQRKISKALEVYRKLKEAFYHRRSKDLPKDLEKLDNDLEQLSLLLDISKDYSSLRSLLDDLLLEGVNPDDDSEYLTISTIHSAKGLEWENVFLLYANDESFPGERDLKSSLPEAIALHNEEIEESRRLLYVAITRAKRRLDLIFPDKRINYGKIFYFSPSRFFAKIDVEKLCNCFSIESSFIDAFGTKYTA